MSTAFDAYHKWLGIPPKDQPPHYYRLLGIELFESDPSVIESAADRQMTHLRSFQTGPQAELSQRLLNEIAAAKLSLLRPDKKAAYDARLQEKLASRPAGGPGANAPTPSASFSPRQTAGPPRGNSSPPKAVTPTKTGFIPPAVVKPVTLTQPNLSPSLSATPNPPPPKAIPIAAKPRPVTPVASELQPLPDDLLEFSLPLEGVDSDPFKSIPIPTYTQSQGSGAWSISWKPIVVIVSLALLPVLFQMLSKLVSFGTALVTVEPPPITVKKQTASTSTPTPQPVTVSKPEATASDPLNGVMNRSTSTGPAKPSKFPEELPAVASETRGSHYPFTFEQVLGVQPADAEPAGEPVDLLSLVSPEDHSIDGLWRRDGRALVCPAGGDVDRPAISGGPRVEVPYELPGECQIDLTVERLEGNGPLVISLPYGNQRQVFFLDHQGKCEFGLRPNSLVSGRDVKFLPGASENLTIVLSRGGVLVRDEKQVLISSRVLVPCEWPAPLENWSGQHHTTLLLGAVASEFKFTKLRLTPLAQPADVSPANSPYEFKVDLLLGMKLPDTANENSWTLENGAVLSPTQAPLEPPDAMLLEAPLEPPVAGPRLTLRDALPAEYRLELSVERLEGDGPLVLGLSGAGRPFTMFVDWFNFPFVFTGEQSLRVFARRTPLQIGQPRKLVITVSAGLFQMLADDQEIFRATDGYQDYFPVPGWNVGKPGKLLIGAAGARFRITEARLFATHSDAKP